MVRRINTPLKHLAVALFAVFMVGCVGRHVQSPAVSLQYVVDNIWNEYKLAHGLPGGGMAVYIENPSGKFFAASGMASDVDQNTRFRIASNTKSFTASAIMLLDQQGKLRIDDTIVSLIPAQAIPYVPITADYNIPYKAEITIRELLSHTAGVFDVTNEAMPASCPAPYAGQAYERYVVAQDANHQFSPDELVGVDATCQASYFPPGTDFKYSNTGYSILVTIIERVSGMTYEEFLLENLIAPNGLTSTSVPILATDRTIPAPFNPGYDYDHGVMKDVTDDNMSGNIGEGNIISTPADLARWVKRLVLGEAGPDAASTKLMMTPTPQAMQKGSRYGFGLFAASGLGWGHNGAHVGYLSIMMYDAAADVATVLYFDVWDEANLLTAEFGLLTKAALEARAAVGY